MMSREGREERGELRLDENIIRRGQGRGDGWEVNEKGKGG